MCPQTARLCITNAFTDPGVVMGKRGISADSWHEKIPRGSSFKFICKPVEAMNECWGLVGRVYSRGSGVGSM